MAKTNNEIPSNEAATTIAAQETPQDATLNAGDSNTPDSTETPQSDPVEASGDKPDAAKSTGESKYSAEELANAARGRFGVPPEVMTAALKTAGKETATVDEAKKLVKEFMERKVE